MYHEADGGTAHPVEGRGIEAAKEGAVLLDVGVECGGPTLWLYYTPSKPTIFTSLIEFGPGPAL